MAESRTLVSVVTGGAQGIGRAIVEAFVARGDTVVVIDRIASDDERATSLPMQCHYYSVDISQQSEVLTTMEAIQAQLGGIDVLVNNAGITADGLAVRLDADAWQKVLAVNLDGAFWCAQAVLPGMMRKRSGCIINLSSIVARNGNPGQAPYVASKAALEGVTKTLAREYGARGIRVNAIAPGLIDTPLTEKLGAAVYDAAVARISMRRAGTPTEVAELACFLSSSKSSYITGQIIHINGGMW